MSLRSISRTLSVVLLMWATLPLVAQTTDSGQSSTDSHFLEPSSAGPAADGGSSGETKPASWEIFTGYSWMNFDNTVNGVKTVGGVGGVTVPVTFNLKDARGGFVVDISYFFNKWFGITVDTGAHFGDTYDSDEIFAGPTFRFPAEHIQPFIHGLAGWHRLSPGNADQDDGPGFALGGGIDLRVSKHLNIRLGEADYIWSSHNVGTQNNNEFDGVRLSTGLVFLGGVGEEPVVSASCSVDKSEVWAGEPVKATVTPHNFNPKHNLNYDWTTNGGKVQGNGDTVTIDTTGVAEGQSYNVSVHVTDPKNKKAATSCQASFSTKKRLPPTISCQARPDSVEQGGAITIHSDASSPQSSPVTVAITSDCGVSGQGNDVSVDTTNLQPGSCNVTCTVTDDHQLTATSNTSFTVKPKPVVKPPQPPPTLTLRSVYFATAQPTPRNPNGGLVKSQQNTLTGIASEFKQYLAVKPDAKLVLEAHADPRGSDEYNQKLTERRAARVKSFLVEQGIPADSLEDRPLGKQQQLSPDNVKQSMEDDPSLTPGEKKRLTRNMRTIVLAANRRVDLKLEAPGVPEQLSQRRYPFSAADALSLIGGREKPKVAPKAPTRRKGAARSKKGGAARKKK
jgi:outer membrane protein OmpA-like peptidoglycan-associated protein